jgi:hypothetical protein
MKIYLKKFVSGQVTLIFTLVCFAISPQARAVCQKGCLTNNTTVLGEDALLNNTGSGNTTIGSLALSWSKPLLSTIEINREGDCYWL